MEFFSISMLNGLSYGLLVEQKLTIALEISKRCCVMGQEMARGLAAPRAQGEGPVYRLASTDAANNGVKHG